MPSLERCNNCKHLFSRDICSFCAINGAEIKYPLYMGGSKLCACYEQTPRKTKKFKYPTKQEKSKICKQ